MLGARSKLAQAVYSGARLNQRLLLSPVVRFCFTGSQPNNKSLVILDGLPLSITNSTLKEALSGIDTIRKSEVQPGCALHVVDEAGAKFAANKIKDTFKYHTVVKNTCLPSLVLNNIPGNITAENIFKSFEKYDPKAIRFSGKRSVQVTVSDPAQAVETLKLIGSIVIDGRSLSGHVTNTPEGRFCIQITDFSPTADLSVVLNTIANKVNPEFPSATLSASTGTSTVKVRIDTKKLSSTEKINEVLKRITFGKNSPITTEVKFAPRPALVIRNVSNISEDSLRSLCVEDLKAERVQRTWRSRDMFGDLAFAYFTSEADAYAAIQHLRKANLDGSETKIKASYREMSEPAVKISGLPDDITELKIKKIFSQFRIHRASILSEADGGESNSRSAVVVTSDYKEAEKMRDAINLRTFDEVQYSAEDHHISDTVVEFMFSENELPSVNQLEKLFHDAGLTYRSMLSSSNIQAYVAFGTLDHATRSLGALVQGNIKLLKEGNGVSSSVKTAYEGGESGVISSNLSIFPSYVVEVNGISSEDSAENVLQLVTENNNVHVFKSERSATAKFKRHMNVVPGMKLLRGIEIGNIKLRPRRFHEVEEQGDSEYDHESENIKVFDRTHLQLMLKDYLTAEPAIRYQITKNYFERALYTAQGLEDITYILEDGAPNDIKAEVKQLITEKNNLDTLMKPYEKDDNHDNVPKDLKQKLDKNVNRLFQLFVQREDMSQFTRDFDDIEAALGPANPDDAYEWNNFMCNDEESLKRLHEDLRFYNGDKSDRKDAAREEKLAAKKQARRDRRQGVVKGSGDDAEEQVEEKETIAEKTKGKEVADSNDGTTDDTNNEEMNENTDIDFIKDMKEKTSYEGFDADRLMDYDGHLWSGIIVHQDTTQKVAPGERILSYRCLVSIGNRRGAGGFGMGKGTDADIALRNAFRDALKNIIFIDLYENAALAHDLKGKHNDCIVYIRATQKGREMVASPLATSILNGFGIVSCSTKIIGKRHPYAQVRAIFNALSKHKNIDEIAKERGTRYLTLKWMYDNGM